MTNNSLRDRIRDAIAELLNENPPEDAPPLGPSDLADAAMTVLTSDSNTPTGENK